MIDFKSVRDRHDLAQVVEAAGVPLRREGRRLVGRCPFHLGDRTPSFNVYSDTQTFFCFGCQTWGDAVDFVKRLHNLSTEEAVAYLEGEPPKLSPPQRFTPRVTPPKFRLTPDRQAVLDKAVAFYEENLGRNRSAQGYLQERGLTEETICTERIGYCGRPENLAKTLGIRERHLAQEIGLLNEKGRERMWSRLTFPVLRQGKPIWLIGRSLEDNPEVKYLGMGIPKPLMGEDSVSDCGEVWVVEGVFDLLLLRQLARELSCAIPAVALLGTHHTKEVIQTLKEQSRVFLCLDSDSPGEEAALELQQELGSRAILVELPTRSKDIGELLPDEVKDLVLKAYLAPECGTRR